MRSVRIALALLPVLGAVAVETPTPPTVPLVTAAPAAPGLEASLQITRSGCDIAPGVDQYPPPLDLWGDPAAQPSRDYVARQLDLLMHGKMPADAALAAGFQSLSLEIQGARATDPDRRHPPYRLLVQHALAGPLAAAVSALIPDAKPMAIHGFDGTGDNVFFAGAKNLDLLIGNTHLLEEQLPADQRGEHAQPPPALSYHFDFSSVLAVVQKLESAGISYNLDPLLPRWRTEAPQLTALVTADGHGWQGDIAFSARNLPLHEVDPAFAKLLLDGGAIRGLLGITPIAVSQLIANNLSSDEISALETKLGMPLDRAGECLTGDVALLVQSQGIIPQGCLAFGVQPNTRSTLLATRLAQIWKGQLAAAAPPGATLWTLDTPIGPWELAVSPTRLVFGNDPELLRQLMAGTVAKATVPPHVVGFLDCKLPVLAKQWLPLVWQFVHSAHYQLSDDPLQNLSFQIPALATALIQADSLTHPQLSSLLDHPAPIVGVAGHPSAIRWASSFPGDLRAAVGADPAAHGAELEAKVDRSFAIFSDVHQIPVQVVAVVVRKPDGFHILESDHGARKAGLTLQQISPRLSGLHLAMGPALEDLLLLAPLPVPRLDMQWLPDAALIAAHLQPYQLVVTLDTHGAKAHETGEPLASLMSIATTLYMAIYEQPHMLLYQERFNANPGVIPPAPATPPTPGHTVVEF